MFKLSKITDYGVIVLGCMAENAGKMLTAPDLAEATALPQPTVAKILKLLVRADIIISHRGSNGGYALERCTGEINVAEIIEALDSPVALTACVDGAEGDCSVESLCPMRGRWDKLNTAVKGAIQSVSLADIISFDPVPDFINIGPNKTSQDNTMQNNTAGIPSQADV